MLCGCAAGKVLKLSGVCASLMRVLARQALASQHLPLTVAVWTAATSSIPISLNGDCNIWLMVVGGAHSRVPGISYSMVDEISCLLLVVDNIMAVSCWCPVCCCVASL